MTSSPRELKLRQRHVKLQAELPHGGSAILLHIGAEQTEIASNAGPDAASEWVLNMGSQRTVREHFRGVMPDALALENAIAATEDEIAKLPRTIGAPAALLSRDPLVRAIALRCGIRDGSRIQMPLEKVELCFGRLARVAQGSPASHEGLPEDPAFAATLLILRELMHHRRFESLSFVADD